MQILVPFCGSGIKPRPPDKRTYMDGSILLISFLRPKSAPRSADGSDSLLAQPQATFGQRKCVVARDLEASFASGEGCPCFSLSNSIP